MRLIYFSEDWKLHVDTKTGKKKKKKKERKKHAIKSLWYFK